MLQTEPMCLGTRVFPAYVTTFPIGRKLILPFEGRFASVIRPSGESPAPTLLWRVPTVKRGNGSIDLKSSVSAEHFGGELECGIPTGGLKLCLNTGSTDYVVVEIAYTILTT